MGQNSKIEWTDHTVNLWWGCTKVNAGCNNCYAETFANRFHDNLWGNESARLPIKSAFQQLDKMQANAVRLKQIHRVFVGSMMDIFEKSKVLIDKDGKEIVQPVDEDSCGRIYTGNLRRELFNRISSGLYPNLLFLLLTKRPSNINKMIPIEWQTNPPINVMFGTSVVDQATAFRAVNQLRQVNGQLFLSIEPQIEEIRHISLVGIAWVIQGGESGNNRRPFNIDWARSMRDRCRAQNVPYFFKQIDKIQAIPEDLQIRGFPEIYTPSLK